MSNVEVNMMKVALAAHTLVETKGENAGAINSPLGNMEIEEKGLLLRVADRMEAFTSVVVDEVEKRVKECVQVSKDTGEKVEGAVERMATERVSEERRQKRQVEAQKEREKTKTTTTTQSMWQKKGGLSLFGLVVQKET
jgi:hypothetical protein